MGHIYQGIPEELVLKLLAARAIPNFVETGTYMGRTARWAARHFRHVFTIEVDSGLSRQAAAHPESSRNIEFLVGDSAALLPSLVARLQGGAVFWLDGHYSGPGTGGESNECPLLGELDAVAKSKEAVVLIDDARCFLGPLPPPHKPGQWPGIAAIFRAFAEKYPNHTATMVDDVIVAVPPAYKPALDAEWLGNFEKRFPVPRPKGPSLVKPLAEKILRRVKRVARG